MSFPINTAVLAHNLSHSAAIERSQHDFQSMYYYWSHCHSCGCSRIQPGQRWPASRPNATLVSQISDDQVQAATTVASAAGEATHIEATPFGYYSYPQMPSVNSAAVSSLASYAGIPASEIPGATDAVPPIISSQVTGLTRRPRWSHAAMYIQLPLKDRPRSLRLHPEGHPFR